MSEILHLFALAAIGSVAGLIGGGIFLLKREWADKLTKFSLPLAAGVLLAVALTDLLPEAVGEYGEGTYVIILLVFVIVYAIERLFFTLHHHGHPEKRVRSAIPLVIIGDTVHNLLDGIAIGAAFMVDPMLGLFVAFSAFIHETPHEIADFGILLAAGWSRSKAVLVNFISALTTFVGAFFVYFFVGHEGEFLGLLLGIAAALFLYVSTTDFLPNVESEDERTSGLQVAIFAGGAFLMLALHFLLPEGAH